MQETLTTKKSDLTIDWEPVVSDKTTTRLKIPGGWLYKIIHYYRSSAGHFPDTGCQMSVIFVPESR